MLAHDLLAAGTAAHGRRRDGEHDQRALLLDRARGGFRMGHGRVFDHMFLDGLEDATTRGG